MLIEMMIFVICILMMVGSALICYIVNKNSDKKGTVELAHKLQNVLSAYSLFVCILTIGFLLFFQG